MQQARRPSCAVLVPSYRRPADLARCLEALCCQSVRPERVIVVLRHEDDEGRAVVASIAARLPVVEVITNEPGQVAALNRGLGVVDCDITAITDDDTAPRPEWVACLLAHFDQPDVVAVGGRDVVDGAVDGRSAIVGRVAWYGRVTGNHHRGIGPSRDVDVLKGANMSFRTVWLRDIGFDRRLRGVGAQVHNDLMVSLQVRRAGGRVIYDPAVVVDHYPAARPAWDLRVPATQKALAAEAHNETLALMEYLPPLRRGLWLVWAFLCGTRRTPGLAVFIALVPRRRADGCKALMACLRGRIAGLMTWRATRSGA